MDFKKIKGKGPDRIKVDMLDPIFGAASAHTASAPITVIPSGLSCKGELYLGAKVATSGLKVFTSTGVAQTISFPITMPSAGGVSYPVYLDVYADSMLIAAYVGTENVVIPSVTVGPITWA